MRCRGQVEGKDCGGVVLPGVKFCADCGAMNENKGTFNCSCGKAVGSGDKFCSGCGLKVNHGELDVQPKFCCGKNEDGSPCGNELTLCLLFCPKCGTRVSETDTPLPTGKSSVVQKDVNPDVKGSDRFSDGHRKEQEDPTPSPCKKVCMPEHALAKCSNLSNVEQLHGKAQAGAREEVPSDTNTLSDNTGRGNGATPFSATDHAASVTAPTVATPDTATPSVNIVDGRSVSPRAEQASAPVPCTDDEGQGEGSNSSGSVPTQHASQQGERDCLSCMYWG